MNKLTAPQTDGADDQIVSLILSYAECIGTDRVGQLLFALDKPLGKREAGEIMPREELVTMLMPLLIRPTPTARQTR
jgi:hypothetical protein